MQCSDDHHDGEKKDDFNLHEDDYQLLQENNNNLQKMTKSKRLKKSDVNDELRDYIIDEDDSEERCQEKEIHARN